MPIGFRQAHVAARNAELLLARERAILRDQQREVVHEAADAIAEMDRAYAVLQTSYNRLAANRDQLGAVQAAYDNDKAPLDLFLDAQRRVADAETDYHLNRSRYSLAIEERALREGHAAGVRRRVPGRRAVAGEAYHDAAKREARAAGRVPLNYASSRAPIVGAGSCSINAWAKNVRPAKSRCRARRRSSKIRCRRRATCSRFHRPTAHRRRMAPARNRAQRRRCCSRKLFKRVGTTTG